MQYIKLMDETCGVCGVKLCHTIDPQMHHKDTNHANNDPSNIVSICRDCHLVLHRGKHYPTPERNKEIVEMYRTRKDLSLSQIGDLYGVSRQRVFQIVKRVKC